MMGLGPSQDGSTKATTGSGDSTEPSGKWPAGPPPTRGLSAGQKPAQNRVAEPWRGRRQDRKQGKKAR